MATLRSLSVLPQKHVSSTPVVTSRPNARRTMKTIALSYFTKLGSKSAPSQLSYQLPSLSSRVQAIAGTLERSPDAVAGKLKYHGVHHVALLCENLERSLEFYQGVLGLEINPDRPHNKLPYRGAWLWVGNEMIHLMELPNPDPLTNRPEHGGRDRHFAIGVAEGGIKPLVEKLDAAGIKYTTSMSGRPAVFFRDPDMNCLEIVEQESWR